MGGPKAGGAGAPRLAAPPQDGVTQTSQSRHAEDTTGWSIDGVATSDGAVPMTVERLQEQGAESRAPALARGARLRWSRPPRWHRVAEILIRVMALSALAAVVLIFAFVAREALPLFFNEEIHKEVT